MKDLLGMPAVFRYQQLSYQRAKGYPSVYLLITYSLSLLTQKTPPDILVFMSRICAHLLNREYVQVCLVKGRRCTKLLFGKGSSVYNFYLVKGRLCTG